MLYTPLIWPMILAGIMMGGIGLYILRFKDMPAARPFSMVMGLGAAWTLVYAFSISTTNLLLRVFFGNCGITLAMFATLMAMLTVMEYVGKGHWLTRHKTLLFLVMPIIIAILAFTSPFHTLFRYNFQVDLSNHFAGLIFSTGPLYYLYAGYVVLVALIAYGLLISAAIYRQRETSNILLIMLGLLFPTTAGILFIFGQSPIRGLDLSPTMLLFTGLTIIIALVSGRLLDTAHIARDLVMEHIEDLVFVLDTHQNIIDMNPLAKRALGLTGKLQGMTARNLSPAWAEFFQGYTCHAIRHEEVQIGTGNNQFNYDLTITPILDSRSRPMGRLFLLHDITERKRLEVELRASQALYLNIVEDQTDPVCRWHPDTTLTFVNQAYCDYFGKPREQLLGTPFKTWLPPETKMIIQEAIDSLLHGDVDIIKTEEMNISPQGDKRWMVWVYRPVKDAAGHIVEFQSVGRDETMHKQTEAALLRVNSELAGQILRVQTLQEQLFEQAVRDGLTGLFNRRYMQETLEREIASAVRSKNPIGIIMLDLDHFKKFNDNYGHNAGDLVLRQVGQLLIKHTRQMDVACRYGGEEFVIIMPTAPLNITYQRAETLRQAIENLSLVYSGQTLTVTISSGVASYPQHGQNADDILHAADNALYAAKSAGRNCVKQAVTPEPKDIRNDEYHAA